MRDGNEDPLCGSVEYILRPLEVGSATVPRRVPPPATPPVVVPPDEDVEPVGAWIGWPGEASWCE